MSKTIEEQITDLKNAITVQESLRATLGDTVADATIAVLREKLAALETQVASTEQQRKQITVLFADVSGFTAMSETLDAEDVAEVMNALWQRIDAAITAYGGLIDKHIGDAVMALWGAEHAREDDPERAVRAALAMQTEIWDFVETQEASVETQDASVETQNFGSTEKTIFNHRAHGETRRFLYLHKQS
jgi:class 3 adenylate cyclase